MPIPVYLIYEAKEIQFENDIQKDCDYAFHIGYNTVVNWIKIVQPLKMNIENAW